MAEKTKYLNRDIPRISLHDFPERVDEITVQLCAAAEDVGFFAIKDHGLTEADIQSIFAASRSFFALPDEVKATVPWSPRNVGWEKNSQVRPSTGAADQKESYQLQFGENMQGTWIAEDALPGFQDHALNFMHSIQAISEKLMLCFARGLGFADNYFIQYHDSKRADSQSVMRLLHYPPTPKNENAQLLHRAGAHADWGFLTLLFQEKPGYTGLEICPGHTNVTEATAPSAIWTKLHFEPNIIVCNIGDLLMSWSDDRFKSTFHRVKAPCEEGDYFGERYSIAWFNQPVKDAVIQGPKGKYPVVTGEQFTKAAMEKYYGALREKLAAKKKEERGIQEDTKGTPALKSAA